MSVKIKQEVANLEKSISLIIRKCNVFGDHGIVLFYFAEKCKLSKAAENVDKTGDFWLHFIDRVWKIDAPLTKNLLTLI